MIIQMPNRVLHTGDQAASEYFYREVLGIPLLFAREGLSCLHGDGACLILKAEARAPDNGRPQVNPASVLRFNVMNLETAAQHLKSKGIHLQMEEHEWGVIASFCDPDGNRCELRHDQPLFNAE